MKLSLNSIQLSVQEVIFQVFLNIIVFVFYAFDRRIPGIEIHQLFFYLNYAIAGLIINYYLLPNYLYKNKYIAFIAYVTVIVGLVIFVEEAFLEQIYYPDTRGRKFLGIFYNLLSTMPTITILVGFKFAWDALTKQKEVQQLKISVKESELQFLKSQINPHFLFNNMNNLYAHAVEQSPKTPEIILELSAVLRYMLYECKAKFVPLSKEIQHLENYINLNRLQIEGRGHVCFSTQVAATNYQIAPLILLVFIENAFKHSASSQTENIKIEIQVNLTNKGILQFTCNNTYLEQTNTESLNSGIGLLNVKKRLNLIYPNLHKLNIVKRNNWHKVNLQINLTKTH